MRIAYIVEPRKIIGGGVRAAINLAKAMNDYYDENTIIFGPHVGTIKNEDTQFEFVKSLNPIGFSYLKSLHSFLNIYKPDIVHCLGLYTTLALILMRKICRCKFKIVCTVHRATKNMRFVKVIKLVLPFIAKNVNYTTFLTSYQRAHYFNNVGYRPERNIIIPNVIYVERNDKSAIINKRKELMSYLDVDDITCYVGRIIPSKNIEDTIRLIGILNRRGLKIGAILVGGYSNSYFEKLQRIIDEENLQSKIAFEGYVNNPTLYIDASTTTTTTTYGEALPNLMVESFALGKVIFSSDIPQMADLITDGKNGFIHSLKDLEGFADKIQQVYMNPELRASIEQEARSTYNEVYEPHKVASKYHEVYEKILQG